MNHCLFCKIIAGSIPSQKVYEDEQVYAFRDINPVAQTHVLVVPKKHIPDMNALEAQDEALAGHLLRVGAQIAKVELIDQRGYRFVFNTNEDAGQTVFHLHLHVIGGRPLGWPPG
jgi:histidine triad (HIT) family protein